MAEKKVRKIKDVLLTTKDKKISPANCPGTISVGAYTSNRIACPTSGWNPDLFFSSPGDKLKVYSTEGITIEKTCQTSFACPFTAGVIACIISFYKQNKQPYAASDILQTLASSECLDSIANYNPLVHGKGIINPINIINKINQS